MVLPLFTLAGELSANNFHVFLRNRLSDWDKFFAIGVTTHAENFNHNYDVISHVVWQPYWKNGKILELYHWNRNKEKIETWHTAISLHGK